MSRSRIRAALLPGFDQLDDWQDDDLDSELIVLATPLSATAEILKQLAARAPRGLIFDLGSLKTPLRAGLDALVRAGCRVTSLHPMFGPDTQLLSGRHVIFIDMGDAGALKDAQDLFASTMAERVVMSLDEHDRLIAYVLGLSHALNIAFFTALAESGEAAPRLARLSSTTFDAQTEVASRVAAESPDLYFEIQSLNEYGGESLLALQQAVERAPHRRTHQGCRRVHRAHESGSGLLRRACASTRGLSSGTPWKTCVWRTTRSRSAWPR